MTSQKVWLYSLADLAFLLLIAQTQMTPGQAPQTVLEEPAAVDESMQAEALQGHRWELQVLAGTPRFRVVEVESDGPPYEASDLPGLRQHLQSIQAATDRPPMLVPAPDAMVQDLLDAQGLINHVWEEEPVELVARVKRLALEWEKDHAPAS